MYDVWQGLGHRPRPSGLLLLLQSVALQEERLLQVVQLGEDVVVGLPQRGQLGLQVLESNQISIISEAKPKET